MLLAFVGCLGNVAQSFFSEIACMAREGPAGSKTARSHQEARETATALVEQHLPVTGSIS